jgi:L-threonylcarbamoyladenylate synthase
MDEFFKREVEQALQVLKGGGVILYPTDTVWGLGCDATNEAAIRKIFQIKQRAESKSLIVLVAAERDILQFVAAPDPSVFDFLEEQSRPTTIIYQNAIGLPANLVAEDGSVAIRLVQDDFCRHLVKRLQKPVVSTSANISGEPTPETFSQISNAVKNAVDHVVQWRQDDLKPAQPSQIIKWNNDGSISIIRR